VALTAADACGYQDIASHPVDAWILMFLPSVMNQ
jgi:hypothetical protein